MVFWSCFTLSFTLNTKETWIRLTVTTRFIVNLYHQNVWNKSDFILILAVLFCFIQWWCTITFEQQEQFSKPCPSGTAATAITIFIQPWQIMQFRSQRTVAKLLSKFALFFITVQLKVNKKQVCNLHLPIWDFVSFNINGILNVSTWVIVGYLVG